MRGCLGRHAKFSFFQTLVKSYFYESISYFLHSRLGMHRHCRSAVAYATAACPAGIETGSHGERKAVV